MMTQGCCGADTTTNSCYFEYISKVQPTRIGCGLCKKDKSEGQLHACLARATRRMDLSFAEMEKTAGRTDFFVVWVCVCVCVCF